MKKLHLICNAHIDPIWQWTWDEGISSALSTFKSAVNLAKDFDYIFCHGESLLYEAIEKHDPELFADIQRLVKEGKWQITCGWYLQPDCLFPAGETFVRHIAVGKKYFKDKFGVEPTVATSLDAFGHSVGLVQILAKNGYNGYLHCRPFGNQFNYPSLFYNWIGPDGSKIVCARHYGYGSHLGKATEKIDSIIKDSKDENNFIYNDEVCFLMWGVGNHGGGPSRKDLNDILNYKQDGIEIIHSTPESLFSDNIRIGGSYDKSLVTCMPGCYSSMARVKQAYRRTENFFYSTEKMLATVNLTGKKVDYAPLYDAEKKLLLTTFHDILPGSCVEEGEREGLGQLYACDRILRDYRTDAFLQMVMKQKKAELGDYPVFVYNYLPYQTKTLIEVEFSGEDQNWSTEFHFEPRIFDEDGNELTCQRIKEDSTLNLDWRKRIVFEGTLRPLGVTRFTVRLEKGAVYAFQSTPVDGLNGVLDDKLLTKPLSLEAYDDTADPWGMSDAELKQMGTNPVPFKEMTPLEIKDFFVSSKEIAPVRVIEDGNLLKKTECLYTIDKTTAVVDYINYKDKPYTDIKLTVEFNEKNKLIRLKIPMPQEFANGVAVGDGPFVWEEKPNVEVTFQKWLGSMVGDQIFAVINDGVYAGKAEDGYLYLTLLRGSGYCFHPINDRPLYPDDRYLPRIDCGRYVYNLRLFKGNVYEVVKMAEEFNAQPYAINVFPTGEVDNLDLPTISIDGEVILSTVKTVADGSIVLRVYNPSNEQKEFKLNIGDVCFNHVAYKREVVSLKYTDGKVSVMDKMTI